MVPFLEKTMAMYIVQDHELREFLGLQEPWADLFIPQ